MTLALNYVPVDSKIILHPLRSTDERIRAFLDGDTDGSDVLHEIYDDVLDEPIPERLRAILKP